MNSALINLAVPIYYFQQGFSTEIIGFLAAGTTYSYILSPILFNKISQKLKRKTSIIIALSGVLGSQIIFYVTLIPLGFLVFRIIEGLFMGLFWPNLQSSISDNIFHEHSKLIAKYNLSWNCGILGGFLSGAILLFFLNNLLIIFYVSPLLILLDLIIGLLAFKEPRKINKHSEEFKRYCLEKEEKEELDLQKAVKIREERDDFLKISFPVLFPILLIFSYAFTRAILNFLYPIKSEILNFESYTVYIRTFIFAISQIISITFASLMKLKYYLTIPILSVFLTVLIVPFIGITTEFWIFIVIFFACGFFTGILYGVAIKLFLILNMKQNTSKFSSILESLLGFSFLVAPIFAGFFATINLNGTFFLLAILLLIFGLVMVILAKTKIKYNKK
jgi:MFS family permease